MPKSRTCPPGSRKVCIKKSIKIPKEMKGQRKSRKRNGKNTKKARKPKVKVEKKTSMFSNMFGSNEEEKPVEVVEEKPVEVVEEKPVEVVEEKPVEVVPPIVDSTEASPDATDVLGSTDVCLTPEELETIITEYKSVSKKFSAEKEAEIREKMVSFCANDKYKKLEFYPKLGFFNSAREEREELIAQAKTVIDEYLKYSTWSM